MGTVMVSLGSPWVRECMSALTVAERNEIAGGRGAGLVHLLTDVF
jgi:hypothetical protein